MSREEFMLLVKGMKAVYTFENFLADEYSIEMWYSLLSDLPYKAAGAALKNHMQTSTRVPTPADIRNGVYRLTKKEDMTDMEAWGLVSAAISRSGYNSQAEFEKLPETARRAVGSARQLYVWSQTSIDSVETVIQSQFLRAYRAECARAEQKAKMSPDVLRIMEETQRRIEG